MKDKLKRFKFPTVLELTAFPASILYQEPEPSEKILDSDKWIDLIGDRYLEIIQDNDDQEIGTPEVLWWNYLKEMIRGGGPI